MSDPDPDSPEPPADSGTPSDPPNAPPVPDTPETPPFSDAHNPPPDLSSPDAISEAAADSQPVSDPPPARPELPDAPANDFSYLEHDRDTFTGPLREQWDIDTQKRLQDQAEAEQKELSDMAVRAEAARKAFQEKLENDRKSRRQPPPKPPPEVPDDALDGWRDVMDMVGPKKDALPPDKAKRVRNLYFALKK
jgi:hypothetical protein